MLSGRLRAAGLKGLKAPPQKKQGVPEALGLNGPPIQDWGGASIPKAQMAPKESNMVEGAVQTEGPGGPLADMLRRLQPLPFCVKSAPVDFAWEKKNEHQLVIVNSESRLIRTCFFS